MDSPVPGHPDNSSHGLLPARGPTASTSLRVLATLAVMAALWWGQRFLIPLVVGLMLAMLLVPLTVWLEARLRSRALAAILSLLLAAGVLVGAATLFGTQLLRVAERTPQMISMAATQLSVRESGGESVLLRVRNAMQELDRAADGVIAGKALPVRPERTLKPTRLAKAPAPPASAASAADATPNSNLTEAATEVLREGAVTGSGVLASFAGNLSIIFFISLFVLTGGRPLSDRFLDLWGYDDTVHRRATATLLECGRQIRRYAGVLLITNALIGVLVWLAFLLAGLPDAGGWGVTAAVLHVLPYVGMAVLTVLGSAETFLAQASIGAALGMGMFLVLVSTVVGVLVTAWLQGRAARMNPASVFIGLVFWGCLWGLWGLFLGPALIVLFKVIAEHLPSGQRLARLMQA